MIPKAKPRAANAMKWREWWDACEAIGREQGATKRQMLRSITDFRTMWEDGFTPAQAVSADVVVWGPYRLRAL